MMFGQLTFRDGLRDIINCLNAHRNKVYHIGIKTVVSQSTLSRANERRNWQIWSDFANYLIGIARPLYLEDTGFKLDLDNTVYALDSSTIESLYECTQMGQIPKTKGCD